MEKLTPHYNLAAIQARVAELGVGAFTKTALDGGREMGLTSSEMLAVVAALTRRNFYKAMTTVKITMRSNTPVIQFKER